MNKRRVIDMEPGSTWGIHCWMEFTDDYRRGTILRLFYLGVKGLDYE